MENTTNNYKWHNILKDSVKNNIIKELHLRNIPSLKNCKNWNDIKEIGTINHRTKHAQYFGLLVSLGENIYYVSQDTIEALKPYRSWNLKNKIKVTEIEK